MMDSQILSPIGKKAIIEFRIELVQMLRIANQIDKCYADSSQDANAYLKKFNTLIADFNKKYKIRLRLAKKTSSIRLKMFLNEKNVRDVFENAASKIIGVQSIGTNKFGAATVSEPKNFADELEKAKDKLYVTYYDPQTGTSNVFLRYDKKEKKVQLVFDMKEIVNDPSPEFQLAAYYALRQDYNKKINLHDEAATLGFSSWLTHVKKREWLERFDPHSSE